jgi:hypothetical protein
MRNVNIIITSLALLLSVSCGEVRDRDGSTTNLFVENKTDFNIEIVYKMNNADTTSRFQINNKEKVKIFTQYSGLGYDMLADPSSYDTVYLYYQDKIIIDSIKNEGLLSFYDFVLIPSSTYKKKHETYYERIFTIDEDYINSHLVNE